jgi:hypothetical protein
MPRERTFLMPLSRAKDPLFSYFRPQVTPLCTSKATICERLVAFSAVCCLITPIVCERDVTASKPALVSLLIRTRPDHTLAARSVRQSDANIDRTICWAHTVSRPIETV